MGGKRVDNSCEWLKDFSIGAMRSQAMEEKYDLAGEEWLDMNGDYMKQLTEDELVILSSTFDAKVTMEAMQVQSVVDYVARMIETVNPIMSNLDLSKLSEAINAYNAAHKKTEPAVKPELTV